MERKSDSPNRSVTDVGVGDFVKVGTSWLKITDNPAHGSAQTPRSWAIGAENGRTYGMFQIGRYAKAEDMRP